METTENQTRQRIDTMVTVDEQLNGQKNVLSLNQGNLKSTRTTSELLELELDSLLKRTIEATDRIQNQGKKPGRHSKTHERWMALRAEMEEKKFGYVNTWFDHLFGENWRRELAGSGVEMEQSSTEKWKSGALRKVSPLAIKKVIQGISGAQLWKSPFPPKPFEFLQMCWDTKIKDLPDPFVDELGFYSDDKTDEPLQGWASKFYWDVAANWCLFSDWSQRAKDPYFNFVYKNVDEFRSDIRRVIYSRGLDWIKSELTKIKTNPDYEPERIHQGPKFDDRETLRAWKESGRGEVEKVQQRAYLELLDAEELVIRTTQLKNELRLAEEFLEAERKRKMAFETELENHYEGLKHDDREALKAGECVGNGQEEKASQNVLNSVSVEDAKMQLKGFLKKIGTNR